MNRHCSVDFEDWASSHNDTKTNPIRCVNCATSMRACMWDPGKRTKYGVQQPLEEKKLIETAKSFITIYMQY